MSTTANRNENALHYKGYFIENNTLILNYSFKGALYSNKIFIIEGINWIEVPEVLLHHLGIFSAISFYEIKFFEEIFVEPVALSEIQKDFYSKVFDHSLREFKFKKGINITQGTRFRSSNISANKPGNLLQNKAIILNGGGKDTAVAVEVIKSLKIPFTWLSLNDRPHRKNLRNVSNNTSTILFEREKDVRIPKYSTHKPLNALLAMLATIAAHATKSKYVITANEQSANQPTLIINGEPINHQYTKSFEFEIQFNRFLRDIGSQVEYVSILRPLYEIQIAMIFTKFPQYFGAISSCNRGQKEGVWCKSCSKCAFIFLVLSAFLTKKDLSKIIGENLWTSSEIRNRIVKLCDPNTKPFECVGTTEENQLALLLAAEKHPEIIVYDELKQTIEKNLDKKAELKESYLNFKEHSHNLPENMKSRAISFYNEYLANK